MLKDHSIPGENRVALSKSLATELRRHTISSRPSAICLDVKLNDLNDVKKLLENETRSGKTVSLIVVPITR